MLERVSIKNFRCFRELQVELKPLTVLIGQNDAGKSNFLAAFQSAFLGGDFTAVDHWRGELKESIQFQASGGPDTLGLTPQNQSGRVPSNLRSYLPIFDGHVVPAEAETTGGVFRMAPVENGATFEKHRVRPGKILRDAYSGGPLLVELPSNGPRMVSEGWPDSAGPLRLGGDGSGVPSLFDYLLRRDRARFDELTNALRTRVPGLDEVRVGTPQAQMRALMFRLENGFDLPAERSSVGVRLLLFFLALAFHPEPPGIILLEEPENGVHPRRLADIVALLRDISRGAHGAKPAQIILTTHSPYLLDHIDLSQDQVLVFRRNDDGSRTAEPVDAARLKDVLGEFMLGEVWFNEQEQGLIRRGGHA